MLHGDFEKYIGTLEEEIQPQDTKSDAGSSEQQAIAVKKILEGLLPDIEAFDREYEAHKSATDEVDEHRAKIEAVRQHMQASSDKLARLRRDERQFEEIVNENREKLESAPEAERGELTELLERAQADLSNCRQIINDLETAISEAGIDRAEARGQLDEAETRLQAQEQRWEAVYERVIGKIQDLLNSLNVLSKEIILGIFPSDGARFLVENKSKIPLQKPDELLEKIRDLKRAPENAARNDADLFFRLNCKSLEEELQSLVDLLTAKRVAEEMDGPTYVNLLRQNYDRISQKAEMDVKVLAEEQKKAECAQKRLQNLECFLAALSQTFSGHKKRMKAEESTSLASGLEPERIADLCKKGASFCEKLGDFLKQSDGNLKNLQNDLCSAPNRDAAEQQSRLVSQAIERRPLLRPHPFIVATAFTILVKGILARNNAELLHDNSITILVASFVASWAFSIWLGFSARKKKMKALRTHTARQIRHIIMPRRSERLVSWIKRTVAKSRQMILDRRLLDEAVKFPSIEYGAKSAGNKDQSVFQWRNENFWRTANVAALNCAILAFPAAVLFGWDRFIGNTVSGGEEHRVFVARLPEAPPCVLARGRLVFATKADYFVREVAPSTAHWTGWVLQIFPEIGAQVVPRDLVIRVIPPEHTDDDHGLLDCTATDPNHNTLRVHHAGKALDALGEKEVRQEILSGLQKIAESLSGAPTAVWSPETDPEIAEARNEMEELLAVTDPSEFDGPRFAAAFVRIRQSLAEKLVIAEKLSIADTMRLTWPRAGSFTPSTKFPNPLQVDLLDQDELEALTELVARIATSNEKLAQLIEQEIPLGNSPAAVVLPILHELQENTPSSDVQPSTWITNLLVPNGAPAGKSWPDTLILPFFNDEVKFSEKDKAAYDDRPLQMAFVFGARQINFDDPALGRSDKATYFSRIAEHLEQCLKRSDDPALDGAGAELTLDIIGLASRTWKDVRADSSKEQLNLALAEGRRAATLSKLAKQIPDKEAQNRIHIMISDSPTDTLSLAQISDLLAGKEEEWHVRLSEFDRFSKQEELAEARSYFITTSASKGEARLPLEELFARSVVVKVEQVRGGPCAKI
ncbi:hypothetical protein LCM27_03535 [Ruegeria marisrubri]|uniref:hypothetical protein n=1 Tax=Ruegeria marisrubri TaxID=1685379 RepID=UPI001CD75A14|nr:hypothetical protein [Ruegeria marisrubri]MCA0905464.1 hypothetical protein [Ruegeria marisrubri]